MFITVSFCIYKFCLTFFFFFISEKSNATTVATDDSLLNGDDPVDNADIVSGDSEIFGGQESLEVNANYSKVLTFLELYTSLKECPPELHQQVIELQSLSSEVTRSIALLKEKADSLPLYWEKQWKFLKWLTEENTTRTFLIEWHQYFFFFFFFFFFLICDIYIYI